MAYDTNHNSNFVELFAIGNELLVGQVLDTNSHWLVRNLTGLGAQARRVAMIRDDYDDIEAELGAAIRRAPRLIITTGGLGPTDDDMTFRALARMLKVELELNPIALEMVRQRYAYIATIRANFNPDLNEARTKMAYFPPGGEVLNNPDGAAPALALDIPAARMGAVGSDAVTTILCLPGVPSEMKSIFTTSAQPVLSRTIGAGGYVERSIVLDQGDESRIAALLHEVQAHEPRVYVKSRGQQFEEGVRLTVVLSRGGTDLTDIRESVHRAEIFASHGLRALGYDILRVVES